MAEMMNDTDAPEATLILPGAAFLWDIEKDFLQVTVSVNQIKQGPAFIFNKS